MTAISTDVVIQQLLAVLAEAFDGPAQEWSYFTDRGAESGLLGTLASLTAADASHVWNGSTIAAHANHLRFALAASAAWLGGGPRLPRLERELESERRGREGLAALARGNTQGSSRPASRDRVARRIQR